MNLPIIVFFSPYIDCFQLYFVLLHRRSKEYDYGKVLRYKNGLDYKKIPNVCCHIALSCAGLDDCLHRQQLFWAWLRGRQHLYVGEYPKVDDGAVGACARSD